MLNADEERQTGCRLGEDVDMPDAFSGSGGPSESSSFDASQDDEKSG
jgi:hypothetical protein